MKYEKAVENIEKKLGVEPESVTFTNDKTKISECIANFLADAGVIEKPKKKLYYIKILNNPCGYLNLEGSKSKKISLSDKGEICGYKTKFTLDEIKKNPLLLPFIDKIEEI